MKDLKRLLLTCCIVLGTACITWAQDEVISLYEGPAPGSETWDWEEEAHNGIVTGVSRPTLTVYRPKNPNGVGMVVCPGGGFCYLAYANEGEGISKVLNSCGVTCFVLKYRLFLDSDIKRLARYFDEGRIDSISAEAVDAISAKTIPLALDDAANAIRYIRSHAAQYGVDPEKIGITGSSAGGCITMGTAMTATADDCRPNFAVACYPYFSPYISRQAPEKPLPLFIVACSDDPLVPITDSLDFFRLWTAKGQKTEMHVYQKGGHGFVCIPQGCAVDTWTDNMSHWFEDIFPENFK